MKRKAIVFTDVCKAELLEEEISPPARGQVLVKLAVSTISSGTERANLVGEANVSIDRAASTVVTFPRRGGYSSAGTVVAIGEGVTELAVGDRVAMSWTVHAQYVCKDVAEVYKLDAQTPFSEAALWHISTFPMAAIRKCRLEMGESAMVMGMGVLGLMAVKLLKIAGAAPVIAVDPVAEKRRKALEVGADFALDPTRADFEVQVRAAAGGGMNVAIEVTGNGKALDQALDCMAKFGRVALLGCTRHSDFTIDYYKKVHGPGITLIGAHTLARPQTESAHGLWTTRDDVLTVQKLFRFGRLELGSLVEETHSPEEAPQVYARLADGKSFPVVQFDWEGWNG